MKLKELFEDYTGGMTQFQDDYFVTTKSGGTVYGQYKQALRELYTRFRSLRDMIFNYEEMIIDIEEIQEQMKSDTLGKFDKRRKEIELQKKILGFDDLKRSLKELKREFIRFYQQAVFLRELIVKQHGELTDSKMHELDKDMWIYKLKEMAAINYVAQGRISSSTYEIMQSLPPQMRMEAARAISDPKNLVEWYENNSMVLIPDDLSHIQLPSKSDVPELDYEFKMIDIET
jgi:hypothetical protein